MKSPRRARRGLFFSYHVSMSSRTTIDWSLVPAQFGIWTFVCILSAAPSFFMGGMIHSKPSQIAAMATGVLLFIVAYTLIGSSKWAKRARRNRVFRRTVQIGYGTRIAISVIFPVSFILDGLLGGISISATDSLFSIEPPVRWYPNDGNNIGFVPVFFTTILQGCLLNVVLLIYMSLVYGIARLVIGKQPAAGVCLECGYDLRASRDVCPECGTRVRDNLVRVETVEV
jgi:hypothetical protein